MKVALVYDRINKFGGAERVLLALHQIWPQAPLFTSVYDPQGAPWAKDFKVIYSWAQKMPLAKKHHEIYPWLMPFVFESFDFSQFDLVISVTSAEAKGIITQPKTCHLCYCLTPTRYLWSGQQVYLNNLHLGFFNPLLKAVIKPTIKRLKEWDLAAGSRPDYYLAISQTVKRRIKKYYQREAAVIYPPVDTEKFKPAQNQKDQSLDSGYFLAVSRLVSYKRIDLIIKAFNILGWPLKIIGKGAEEKFLKRISRPNIEFLGGNLTDKQLIGYYQNCLALVFAGIEDFGLVSLEAQACGKPVIAFNQGGIKETVINNKTGLLFNLATEKELIKTIKKFKASKFRVEDCRKNALKYSKRIFIKKFRNFAQQKWQEYQGEFK